MHDMPDAPQQDNVMFKQPDSRSHVTLSFVHMAHCLRSDSAAPA